MAEIRKQLEIKSNREIARGFFEMRLSGENGITGPGQFINISIEGCFLRRPISVSTWKKNELAIVYKSVGRGTEIMSRMKAGQKLDVLSPLGNGFTFEGGEAVLIGGGAGVATMLGLGKEIAISGCRPVVIAGFNSADEVFYEKEFANAGARLLVSTEDGSRGIKGFVTDVLKTASGISEKAVFYVCGPEKMLKAVNDVMPAEADGQFSFEERMGCGFGACMGCSCRTKYGSRRICKDGPVLRRGEIIW